MIGGRIQRQFLKNGRADHRFEISRTEQVFGVCRLVAVRLQCACGNAQQSAVFRNARFAPYWATIWAQRNPVAIELMDARQSHRGEMVANGH